MKRLITLALLAGLTAIATAGDMTPASPTAGATLDLIGPTGAIQPGEEAELKINNLTLEEIQAAKKAGHFDLTVYPLEGVNVDASYDWLFSQLELEFSAKQPGKYLVKLALDRTPTIDDPWEIAAVVITVGDKQDDDPNPPQPPTPSGPRQLVLVWESGDQSPAVAAATLSAELKAYLSQHGHHLWIVDQDQQNHFGQSAPTGFALWIEKAKTHGPLPVLFINAAASSGDSAKTLYQGPPPATATAWLELLKKHGG